MIPMSMRDHYRTRAAEFHARARNESDEMTRRQYESLADYYLRLAAGADRDADYELRKFTQERNNRFALRTTSPISAPCCSAALAAGRQIRPEAPGRSPRRTNPPRPAATRPPEEPPQ